MNNDDPGDDYDYGCYRCGKPGGNDWGPSFCCRECTECNGNGRIKTKYLLANGKKYILCIKCNGKGWVKNE